MSQADKCNSPEKNRKKSTDLQHVKIQSVLLDLRFELEQKETLRSAYFQH